MMGKIDEKSDLINLKLNWFINQTEQLKLNDTKSAAELVLKRYNTKKLDEDTVNDFVSLFELEFSQQDPSYEKGLEIIRLFWDGALKKRTISGKLINPYPVDRTRINQLDNNLGIIHDEILSEKESNKRLMLLLCLGHIIRKEVWFDYFKKWFTEIGNISSIRGEKIIDDFIKEYFTIRSENDIYHIRNSIAHGNFNFTDEHNMEFQSHKDGKIIFNIRLNDGDLIQLNNMFEKKARFLDLFIEFEIIMKLIANYLYKK